MLTVNSTVVYIKNSLRVVLILGVLIKKIITMINKEGKSEILEVMDIFLIVEVFSQMYTHVQTYPVVYIKYGQLYVCQSHLNKVI